MKKSLGLVILIITVWFAPFFLNPAFLTQKDNDLGRTYIPIFSFLKKSVYQSHQIPLWRPDQFMGETFIGNPLASLFYPGNLIFIIFEAEIGAVIYLYIHILIAAISAFYLTKSFSLTNRASVVAGIFYALSTKILVHVEAGHITLVAALALFPLSVYFLRRLLKSYNSKWLFLCSLSLSLTYFAHPAIFYYSFVFVVVYWIYKIFPNNKISEKQFLKSLTIFGFLVALTISTVAIELIPHLEFAPLSTRSQLTLEDVAQPVWNIKRLASSLIFPYLENNLDHEAYLYLGLVPMILSLLGFLKLPKIKKAILLSGSFFMLLYISGLSTPFFPLLYKFMPFLSNLRITTRPWFIVALIVAILSAFAIDRIKSRKIVCIALTLFILEVTLIFSQRLAKIPNLSFTNESLYEFLSEDKDLFRVYCTTYCFNPQLLSKYQIQVLNGESPAQQANIIDFLNKAGNYNFNSFAVIFPPYQVWQSQVPAVPNTELLGLANVKYVASTYEISDENFAFIKKFENILLYKNNLYKPRFYFQDTGEPLELAFFSPNEINLKFEKQKTTKTIIISDVFYPGWDASVVNQKFNVLNKEPIGQKVTVPADTSDIWLKFQPKSFVIGRTITIATFVFMLLFRVHENQKTTGYDRGNLFALKKKKGNS